MKEHDATETAYRNGYAEGKPKWISVKERLPEKDGWYLGITKTSNIYVLPFSTEYKLFNTISGSGTENALHVTHWMPLPEPPKGECSMKCDNCKKHDDCATGSGLLWPCGAYVPKVFTNADKIRAMSDEELAEFLTHINPTSCQECAFSHGWRCQPNRDDYSDFDKCEEGRKRWLQQPAEEV